MNKEKGKKRRQVADMKSVAYSLKTDLKVMTKNGIAKRNQSGNSKDRKVFKNRKGDRNFKRNPKFRDMNSLENITMINNKLALMEEDKTMRLSCRDDINELPDLPKSVLAKYRYKDEAIFSNLRTKNTKRKEIIKHKIVDRDRRVSKAEELAARTEILRSEEAGFLEADPGESTDQITQKQIQKAVDITSATKHFQLHLNMGPYRINYTRDGRYLLLGGKKGHISAFDWMTKDLMTEVGVMEDVYDVQWLHRETMFAAAQKEWVYIYDRNGVELHCMRNIFRPIRMTFLPYHMLLVSTSDTGYISWLDTSMGTLVANTKTGRGRSSVLEQNPQNAVVCLGDCKGVVSMWSPSIEKPLVSFLCHTAPVRALTIDTTGTYMVTGGANRQACVWDLRKLSGKPLWDLRFDTGSPNHLAFSQKSLLAVGIDNVVEVYRDTHTTGNTSCYMRHRADRYVSSLEFAGWEDVLGIGTDDGFTSILVPGAGEANVDGLVGQPLAAKQQRRELEVKALLDKLPPNTICLDPTAILKPHLPTAAESLEAAKKILTGKGPKVDLKLKNKTKRRIHASKVRRIIKTAAKKEYNKEIADVKKSLLEKAGIKKKNVNVNKKKAALDRFRSKK